MVDVAQEMKRTMMKLHMNFFSFRVGIAIPISGAAASGGGSQSQTQGPKAVPMELAN